jgi:hypothetical protein
MGGNVATDPYNISFVEVKTTTVAVFGAFEKGEHWSVEATNSTINVYHGWICMKSNLITILNSSRRATEVLIAKS